MAISGKYAVGDEIVFKDVEVEVDRTPASSSWEHIDSWATDVSFTGGDTPTNETYPFTSDVIILPGNRNPIDVTVTVLYTEGSTDPFQNIYDDYDGDPGLRYDVRWAPAGSGQGGFLFSTTGGKLVQCTVPVGSGDATSPNTFQFTIRCSGITRGTES